MEEHFGTRNSLDAECILPHDPCDDDDDNGDNYPCTFENDGHILEIPTGIEKMDSSTDVEIKEEVGELFMGNEENLQTIFPSGLILINDQPTVAAGSTNVRPGQTQVLSYTSLYNNNNGTPSFLQASEWKCSIIQRNKSLRVTQEANNDELVQISHRPGQDGIQRDPVMMSPHKLEKDLPVNSHSELANNFLIDRKVPCVQQETTATIHTGEKRYKCTLCHLKFVDSTERSNHIIAVHEAPIELDGKLYCGECNAKFLNSWDLASHRGTHTGRYECVECEKVYSSSSSLRYHRLTLHTNHKCEECGKGFVSNEGLEIHMAFICTGERKYQCFEPGRDKSFVSPMDFRVHKDLQYKCDECGNVYPCTMNLMRHKKAVHNKNKREHKCKECGKVLASTAALGLHKGIHTIEKKYKNLVEGCDKSFVSPMVFKGHKDSQAGEKLYKCEKCGNEFLHKKSMMEHKRTVHVHTSQ